MAHRLFQPAAFVAVQHGVYAVQHPFCQGLMLHCTNSFEKARIWPDSVPLTVRKRRVFKINSRLRPERQFGLIESFGAPPFA
jgi:hypothetical protein